MTQKFLATAMACLLASSISAQTLIQYGKYTVSKDEFLKAFNKNNSSNEASKAAAIKEYIELYTNFKLKVKEAEDLRLDTLAQVKFDVSNFRQQIIENYLSNNKGVERLVQEAFKRSQKDLHVLHFSAPIAAGPDSAKAFTAIQNLYNALKANSNDEEAFKKVQAMDAGIRSSNFGFVTAFTLPYTYENMVYALQPGQVSKPYRSKTAWHIFKVKEERPSAGRWKLAQILIAVPEHADAAMIQSAKDKADEIYNKLKTGESFATLARSHSEDRTSNYLGGELPEFTTGTYSPEFEAKVFAIKNDGDVAPPFKTAFGFHIVKRLEHRPTPQQSTDEIFMNDLKQKVLKDDRINEEKELFNRQVMHTTGMRIAADISEKERFQYADSLLKNPLEDQIKRYPIYHKKILHFKNGSANGSEWLQYVQNSRSTGLVLSNEELWEKYKAFAAMQYYKAHLEQYNPDFAFQMKEFRDGNLLFEVMERKVWSKASSNNAALQQYYHLHKANYQWAASADVLIFNCTSPKIAEEALLGLKKGKDWKVLAAESANAVQADSGRYELSQIVGGNLAVVPTRGSYSAIASNMDGSSTFVKYINVYPAHQQRSFEEARGLVINDYQQELEKQWIAALRKKYPVKVNQALLKQLIK